LIPIIWLAVTAILVAVCNLAARSDAVQAARAEPHPSSADPCAPTQSHARPAPESQFDRLLRGAPETRPLEASIR
jgi:hypothetical protein